MDLFSVASELNQDMPDFSRGNIMPTKATVNVDGSFGWTRNRRQGITHDVAPVKLDDFPKPGFALPSVGLDCFVCLFVSKDCIAGSCGIFLSETPRTVNISYNYDATIVHTSDSFFDSPSEYISNITEWRKDIPAPIISAQEFSFSSEFQDMHTSEFFESKDTASECSMDSAYQSQSGTSQRGARTRDGQDRTRRSNQFVGSDIYSPSLSSENYTTFPEQTMDMSHMHQPLSTGAWEPTDGSLSYANFSTGQDYTLYATSSMPRFTPTSNASMSSQWAASELQNAPFAFTSYPTGMMFGPSQQEWNTTPYEATERPSVMRSSSSYTAQDDSRRASAPDNFGAFVATPTSTTSVHFPQNVEFDQSRFLDTRNENEEPSATSHLQSVEDNEDILSQSEAAETKLEEERTKVARSHPLYQRLPDKDGKYHCPEEGKPGCTHKPTPLKCNYDKYVDSHLKPFRCNKTNCAGVQFSSTACLLRHEREAHGMHGHGARPHLCHFSDCERAVPGHGFPRRYNLFDHMKRVHQYDGPTTEPSPSAHGQSQRKAVNKKRKASSEEVSEKRQKVIKLSAEQLRQQRREALTSEFLSKKQHIIDILTNLSSPSDLRDDIHLTKEVVGLHDICTQYRESFGG